MEEPHISLEEKGQGFTIKLSPEPTEDWRFRSILFARACEIRGLQITIPGQCDIPPNMEDPEELVSELNRIFGKLFRETTRQLCMHLVDVPLGELPVDLISSL